MAGAEKSIFLNDIEVDPKNIKAVLINEVVPQIQQMIFMGQQMALIFLRRCRCFNKLGSM